MNPTHGWVRRAGIELLSDQREDLSGKAGWIRDHPSLGSHPRKKQSESELVFGTARRSDQIEVLGDEREGAAEVVLIVEGTGFLDADIRSSPLRPSLPGSAGARELQVARSRFPRDRHGSLGRLALGGSCRKVT